MYGHSYLRVVPHTQLLDPRLHFFAHRPFHCLMGSGILQFMQEDTQVHVMIVGNLRKLQH